MTKKGKKESTGQGEGWCHRQHGDCLNYSIRECRKYVF